MLFSKSTRRRWRWRYVKTVVLAVFATAALVWGAITRFDVDPAELQEFFWLSAAMVGTFIVLGLFAAALIVAIKKLRRR